LEVVTLIIELSEVMVSRIEDWQKKRLEPGEAGSLAYELLAFMAGWVAGQEYVAGKTGQEENSQPPRVVKKVIRRKSRLVAPTPTKAKPLSPTRRKKKS
jgi:hypothetical protein